ncbi:hypothetical protein LTR10_021110 [Elasticomyces elasticus]|uniref:Uncharacterized protein n=1 Tax=Exophiala sideris TaxID=1016849 RepID=A0ABR0J6Z6_9EURO|nr:hypothetical protein LTR10_021110 [Elasticomyces elasticus]KAK5028907.1 hypothetical protein LTS07_006288 [Exophiala sideris]KAK5035776.1 hypothetical protein LTR13_005907 [Exophiala sideris]KAK5057411.1 hypothetical protein LTR69_007452 [Exophiala sideris]KAK5181613.1 hypothetical protein LTR44_005812 [Eurotiomycetes sp. CCFEE 6388]
MSSRRVTRKARVASTKTKAEASKSTMPKSISLAEAMGATLPPPAGAPKKNLRQVETRARRQRRSPLLESVDTVEKIHGLIQAAKLIVKDEKYKDDPKVNVLRMYRKGCKQAMHSESWAKPGFYCGDEYGNQNMYEEMMVTRKIEAEEIEVLDMKHREAKKARFARLRREGHPDPDEPEEPEETWQDPLSREKLGLGQI